MLSVSWVYFLRPTKQWSSGSSVMESLFDNILLTSSNRKHLYVSTPLLVLCSRNLGSVRIDCDALVILLISRRFLKLKLWSFVLVLVTSYLALLSESVDFVVVYDWVFGCLNRDNSLSHLSSKEFFVLVRVIALVLWIHVSFDSPVVSLLLLYLNHHWLEY